MTSDRIFKHKGTNDIFSSRVAKQNKNYYNNTTKKQRADKAGDIRLKKTIERKCMAIGCKNQYTNQVNLLCETHQPTYVKPKFITRNGVSVRIR